MGLRDAYCPLVIASLVIDGIAVGLRLWTRSIKKAIGYDDIAMMFSLVGFVIFCAMEVQAIRCGIGATTIEPDFDLTKAAMFFKAAQIVYILTTGISKLAVGLVLFRLANAASMKIVRRVLAVSMIIVSLWCLEPLDLHYLVWMSPSAGFMRYVRPHFTIPMCSALTIGLRPAAFAFCLFICYTELKLKIMVMVLLGLGAVKSSIAIIIRLKYLIDLSRLSLASGGLATQEAVETTLGGTIYSILEISLSILAASLTALRPLLKTLTCFRTVSFDNPHRSRAFNSMNTLGNGSYTRGTAYRLDDRNVSDADSQENIIPSGLINSRKET
ncbi:hypothetical protein FOC4_g10006383 [Fusarium odoratissimum]|uniref:Rhodopsin domain-containing protein n=1 Tax=Fusarium oxysporum f. sp. cubense (strain race 4) TaxID=2502994 RepID=N1RBR7_FUSC4|nr:hypothetical protein FOC4_g10006383 [Fusarium odoratissimum]